jgi:hypothetical protein
MEDVKIKLSALWVALMLTYLLGDVLRIYSGDFIAGEIGGKKITQGMWLGIAIRNHQLQRRSLLTGSRGSQSRTPWHTQPTQS